MAPQAGFEPATLRLTGGKNDISRPLLGFAGPCVRPRRIWRFFGFALYRALPPFAGLCCSQRARKGQRSESRFLMLNATLDVDHPQAGRFRDSQLAIVG